MSSEEHLVKLGFKFGKNGAHAARSMMIQELTQLLMSQSEQASLDDYRDTIVDANLLHKSSENARKLTFRHLVDLYGFRQKYHCLRYFVSCGSYQKMLNPCWHCSWQLPEIRY